MKRIIPLLLVLILISGCAQVTTMRNNLPGLPQKSSETSMFATAQSMATTVHEPKADATVSGRYKFIPDIEVINLGHADSKGVVCLSGLNQDTFRGFLGCECQDFTTYADEEDGDISQDLSFGPYTILSEDKTEELMTVTTRYTYETTATATACINKDRNSAGCTVTNIANQKRNIMSKSSNGAVLITSITESIIPEDKDTITITFDIELSKANKGEVYDYSKAGYPSCRSEEKQNKKIRGSIEGMPNGKISCTETELDEDGKGTITCEARNIMLTDNKGESIFPNGYEPEITANIKYGYEQIQSIKFSTTPGQ